MAHYPTSRRAFVRALGLGAAALAAPQPLVCAAASRRPNILFIMSDDHASHAMSCYGSRINQTPHLDRIASEGMRFENCFCTNSICAPSRAVILTGKYSHLNGKIDNRAAFDGAQQTFPKILRAAGYETAMVGKWHLRSEPTGFDYWNVLPGQGLYHNPEMIEMGVKSKVEGYVSDVVTDAALRWLDGRDGQKPFLLMLHHKAPHRSWLPAERYASLYADADIPQPETFDDDYATRSDAAHMAEMTIERHLNKTDVKVDPPEGLTGPALKNWHYQRYIKDYLRCVASVDDNVGRVLDYLDEKGLAENTMVVYTSDQGFYLGDHGWYDKRFMYEESLRMPLVVRHPGVIPKGSVSDAMVLNLDFAPTFLDMAGASIPGDMQGRSMRTVLGGDTPTNWRTAMYYHYYEYPSVHMVKRHYGVRTMRYKLIHFYHDIDAWELFDLQEDPNELRNLYEDPAHADVVRDLRAELARLREHYGDTEVDEDLRQSPAPRIR